MQTITHPTNSTAATVVIRRCFICLQLSIPDPSCRRVCGGGGGSTARQHTEELLKK